MTLKNKHFKFTIDSKDTYELIDIFKWISDGEYKGKPTLQIGLPHIGDNKLEIYFVCFYGEPLIKIEKWLVNGINYIKQVYGYEYSNKPINVSYYVDNPNYDFISDDHEGVVPGDLQPKNTNKKELKIEEFDKIEDIVGLEFNSLTISLEKIKL